MFIFVSSALIFGLLSSVDVDCCISKSFFDFGFLLFAIGAVVILRQGVLWSSEPSPAWTPEWYLNDGALWVTATGGLCIGFSRLLLLF